MIAAPESTRPTRTAPWLRRAFRVVTVVSVGTAASVVSRAGGTGCCNFRHRDVLHDGHTCHGGGAGGRQS